MRDEPLARGTPAEVRAREGERVLGAAEGCRIIAFDVGGAPVSSPDLAERLGAWEEEPPQRTALAIGGAEGLAPAVLDHAAAVLSLGAVTLPHQLARVVVAEQVYRALTIRRGLPYHR